MISYEAEFGNGAKYRALALTDSGRKMAEIVNSAIDIRLVDIESLPQNARLAISRISHFKMLDKTGFDITPFQEQMKKDFAVAADALPALKEENRAVLFSPFQSLSINDIQQAFSYEETPTQHPHRIEVNPDNTPSGRDDRSHLFVSAKFIKTKVKTATDSNATQTELSKLIKKHKTLEIAVEKFCKSHEKDGQKDFYPLIVNLFKIMGFKSELSPSGVNYRRWDACIWIGDNVLPIEIKSPTEEEFLGAKAVRQALENKVVLLSRESLKMDREEASLIVGFKIPSERGEMSNLIDNIHKAFKFNIGVIDFSTLACLAAHKIHNDETIDNEQLAHLRGFFDV